MNADILDQDCMLKRTGSGFDRHTDPSAQGASPLQPTKGRLLEAGARQVANSSTARRDNMQRDCRVASKRVSKNNQKASKREKHKTNDMTLCLCLSFLDT